MSLLFCFLVFAVMCLCPNISVSNSSCFPFFIYMSLSYILLVYSHVFSFHHYVSILMSSYVHIDVFMSSCCVLLSAAGDLSVDEDELSGTGLKTWSCQGDLLTADDEWEKPHTDTLCPLPQSHPSSMFIVLPVLLQDASSVSSQRGQRGGPGPPQRARQAV